jgi:hypothetical protein
MSRMPRICLVIALSFVLLAATVPAAQARTLAKSQSSNSVISSWLNAALAWIGDFVAGAPHGQTARGTKTISTGISGDTTTGTARPMTGSCIDPSGTPSTNPKCTGI